MKTRTLLVALVALLLLLAGVMGYRRAAARERCRLRRQAETAKRVCAGRRVRRRRRAGGSDAGVAEARACAGTEVIDGRPRSRRGASAASVCWHRRGGRSSSRSSSGSLAATSSIARSARRPGCFFSGFWWVLPPASPTSIVPPPRPRIPIDHRSRSAGFVIRFQLSFQLPTSNFPLPYFPLVHFAFPTPLSTWHSTLRTWSVTPSSSSASH